MESIVVYVYIKCSTCRKAIKWLDANGIPYEIRHIREQPPSPAELQLALDTLGNIRKLLNTSSQDYREAGLKDTLDSMDPNDVFERLQANGNLVKRPFVVSADGAFAGFNEAVWTDRLL